MNKALTQAYGYTLQTILIDTTTLDATSIDSSTSYKDILTPIQTHQTATILYTKPHNRKWNPKDSSTHTAHKAIAVIRWEWGGKPANKDHHTR